MFIPLVKKSLCQGRNTLIDKLLRHASLQCERLKGLLQKGVHGGKGEAGIDVTGGEGDKMNDKLKRHASPGQGVLGSAAYAAEESQCPVPGFSV